MGDVLVLNINFQPIGQITWQRAVTQWFKGRVEIVDVYEHEIKSTTFSMRRPAVVRELTRYTRKATIKFSRENVYTRDKGRCQYCQKIVSRKSATYDHVVPREQGGKTQWDNIVIACFACNQKKKNRTPEQAGMRLLSKPEKPKHLPQSYMRFTRSIPDVWKWWLSDAYSASEDISDIAP
jgi:5-methylcytosine-specific restriction endonuclease McrA